MAFCYSCKILHKSVNFRHFVHNIVRFICYCFKLFEKGGECRKRQRLLPCEVQNISWSHFAQFLSCKMTKIIELFFEDLKGNPWLKPEDFFQLKNSVSFLASYNTTLKVTRRLVKELPNFSKCQSCLVKKAKISGEGKTTYIVSAHFRNFFYCQAILT